jgi:hypothetical protein
MYGSTADYPTKMLFRSVAGMALVASSRALHLRGIGPW